MFVEQEILLAVNCSVFETEQDLLEAILEYLYDRLYPKLINQLEVWRTKQKRGTKTCDYLLGLNQQFYESNMQDNKIDDWLVLLCFQSITDDKLLKEVMKQLKDIKKATKIINIVQIMEALDDNAKRLLNLDI